MNSDVDLADIRAKLVLVLGLMLLLFFLLLRSMMAVQATGGSAEHTMMPGIVTGGAADRGALQTTLGLGGPGGKCEYSDNKRGNDDFHDAIPF